MNGPGQDRVFIQEIALTYPIDRVFAFFADAQNLEAVTPRSLKFHIVTPMPIEMREGTIIDYGLRFMGIPFRWRSAISKWAPPNCFENTQPKGPYLKWVHTHTFMPSPEGVIMRDQVEYRVPGWILEPLIHRLFVGPQVRAIFAHRSMVSEELLKRGLK